MVEEGRTRTSRRARRALDGVEEMTTLFHVTGGYVYVDPDGVPVGVEDVFTKISSAREHYERVGLGADFVDCFIR